MNLLSTQFLMDVVCLRPEAESWVQSVRLDEVAVSVISVAAVRAEIDAAGVADGMKSLGSNLRKFEALMRRLNGLLAFGEHEAAAWAGIVNIDLSVNDPAGEQELDDANRMVAATAMARGLVLVEEPQPYHGRLPDLRTLDPYA